MNHKKRLLSVVEGAMMLALAWVLDALCTLIPSPFPYGGTISVGMLPIVYFSYRHGSLWGMGAGLVFSGLQMMMGWYVPPANTWWAVVLCVLLDYVLAFTVIGSASSVARLIRRPRWLGYGLGAVAVCMFRFACSFLSGGILWGSYAPEDMNVWMYSLLYNGGYMVPNAVLTGVLAVVLCRALDPKTLRPMKK